MRLLRVAAAALNQTPLDWDGNLANIRQAIDMARSRGVSLLCLPELSITGYGCEDAFFSHAVIAMAEQLLVDFLPATKGMAVSVGLPHMHLGALYNTSALLVDGQLVAVVAKQRLAGDGLHYEPRAGSSRGPPVSSPQQNSPVGSARLASFLFDIGGLRIGFEICEDAWVPDRPGEAHSRRGADIILNPSASHFAFGKVRTRQQLVTEASRVFGVTYVYANLVGNEAGRVIYDGHTLIATHGAVVATGPRLVFSPAVVTDAVVDIDATRMRRSQSASYRHRRDRTTAVT